MMRQLLILLVLTSSALALREREKEDQDDALQLELSAASGCAPCAQGGLRDTACPPCVGQPGLHAASQLQVVSAQRHGARRSHRKLQARRSRHTRHLARVSVKRGAGPERDCSGLDNGMAPGERVWLQAGWLGMFVASLLFVAVYVEVAERIAYAPEDKSHDKGETIPSGLAGALMAELWGMGKVSAAVDTVIVTLGILNFYTYAVETEMQLDPEYLFLGLPIDHCKKYVEILTLVVFTAITVLRLAVIHAHPKWKHLGGSAAPRYIVGNLYMLVEVIALALTFYGYYQHDFHSDWLWLFLARGFEMLERCGTGLGARQLKHMVTDDGKLLLVSAVFGLVVWLLMSGLYFIAMRKNCASLWEPKNDESYYWQRFQSIPSSMWYVLINLLKEHPLADSFTTVWQRVLICVVCIFAMPIFALPTSILQYALFKQAEEEHEDANDGEVVEQDAQRRRSRRSSRLSQALQLQELQNESRKQLVAGLVTFFLALGSILVFFYYTARDTDHARPFAKYPFIVSGTTLAYVDGFVAFCFLCEYLARARAEGVSYIGTTFGLIDLIAWLPGLVHVSIYVSLVGPAHEVLCALCVLRIFKLERYLHSFRDMLDIMKESGAVLTATLVLSGLMWMLFSTLLYLSERENPDEEMSVEVYGSIMRSLWAEIINLHGEWPWADYTPIGKFLGTIIGLFSIMLFCIPISVFGEGFQAKIEAGKAGQDHEEFDRRPWQELCRPEGGFRRQVYDVLYADLHATGKEPPHFRALRALSILLVTASTLTTIISTVEEVPDSRDTSTSLGMAFFIIDCVATAWFVIDYVLRIIATGWRHPCSFCGLCDLVSVAAFAYTLNPSVRSGGGFRPSYKADWILFDALVLFRLLRLFSLESYFHAVHMLKCVLRWNAWPLARAGGALLSIWLVHATLMYIFENPKALGMPVDPGLDAVDQKSGEEGEEDEDEMNMVRRYRSVLTALQYSIVHLFGDYPETEYTLQSKVVHFIGIMGGIAIISTFAGLFSAGFAEYLEDQRTTQVKDHGMRCLVAAVRIKRALKRFIATRRESRSSGESMLQEHASLNPVRRLARAIVVGQGSFGVSVRLLFNAAVVVSLLNSMVASVPEVDQIRSAELASVGIELACTAVFLADYAVRVIARPGRVLSFWGVLDLACCTPGVFILVRLCSSGLNGNPRHEVIVEAFSMLRAVRILNFPCFQREVVIISRVLMDARSKLGVPAYIALNVWITSSALFMWLENEFKEESSRCKEHHLPSQCGPNGEAENMPDVPSAMYWCSIFLTGEWANVDFTYAGSRLCIFYVLFGIAIFSIPVGILVEAVQSTLQLIAVERREMQRSLTKDVDGEDDTVGRLPSASPSHWKA